MYLLPDVMLWNLWMSCFTHTFLMSFLLSLFFSWQIPLVTERKSCSSCLCSLIPATALLCVIYFLGNSYVAPADKEVYVPFFVSYDCKSTYFTFYMREWACFCVFIIKYYLVPFMQKLSMWGVTDFLQSSNKCKVCLWVFEGFT